MRHGGLKMSSRSRSTSTVSLARHWRSFCCGVCKIEQPAKLEARKVVRTAIEKTGGQLPAFSFSLAIVHPAHAAPTGLSRLARWHGAPRGIIGGCRLSPESDNAYPLRREWLLADLSVHPARMLQHRSPV